MKRTSQCYLHHFPEICLQVLSTGSHPDPPPQVYQLGFHTKIFAAYQPLYLVLPPLAGVEWGSLPLSDCIKSKNDNLIVVYPYNKNLKESNFPFWTLISNVGTLCKIKLAMAKCLVARYVLNARQSEIFKENSLKGCFQLILEYQKCHAILKNYFCAFSWKIFGVCAIAQLSTLRNSTLLIRLSSNALKWKNVQ